MLMYSLSAKLLCMHQYSTSRIKFHSPLRLWSIVWLANVNLHINIGLYVHDFFMSVCAYFSTCTRPYNIIYVILIMYAVQSSTFWALLSLFLIIFLNTFFVDCSAMQGKLSIPSLCYSFGPQDQQLYILFEGIELSGLKEEIPLHWWD